MDWIYYPQPRLDLTLSQLQQLRRHLFGGAAAALSDRLSDVELVQLLLISAGQASLQRWYVTVAVKIAEHVLHSDMAGVPQSMEQAHWPTCPPSDSGAGAQWNDYKPRSAEADAQPDAYEYEGGSKRWHLHQGPGVNAAPSSWLLHSDEPAMLLSCWMQGRKGACVHHCVQKHMPSSPRRRL